MIKHEAAFRLAGPSKGPFLKDQVLYGRYKSARVCLITTSYLPLNGFYLSLLREQDLERSYTQNHIHMRHLLDQQTPIKEEN